jgi:serine protease
MKRTALGAILFLIATSAFSAETQRYIVATKRPARMAALGSLARELRDPAERRIREFTVVDAFAADLTKTEVAELRSSPDVRWIEPVVQRSVMATLVIPGAQMTPYGIAQVHAPEAWGARIVAPVNVAIIDSGIDYRHPELAHAYAGGYNVQEPTKPPLDGLGHGTHVAGIIAAKDNNSGVVGVAPFVRFWSVKAVDDTGNGTMEEVVKSIEWVVAKKKEVGGRWVVNMSLGGEEESPIEREAFRKAAAEDIILVAATGNGSSDTAVKPVAYPAGYPDVIAVGAVDNQSVHAQFSNQGAEVDFVAPGVKVISTVLTGTAHMSYVRAADNKVFITKPLTGSKAESLSGEYVFCGLGAAEDFTSAVQGKIALIQRGGDSFATKTRRAKEAGAIGAVIFNKDDTGITWTLFDPEDPTTKDYAWPVAVAMSKADGEALAAKGSGTLAIAYEGDDYDDKNGTSMSTPHVSGAVALLWAIAPNVSPDSIYNALMLTARDLGQPGKDEKYGYGEIDLFAAAKRIAPEAFNPNGQTTGRRYVPRRKN